MVCLPCTESPPPPEVPHSWALLGTMGESRADLAMSLAAMETEEVILAGGGEAGEQEGAAMPEGGGEEDPTVEEVSTEEGSPGDVVILPGEIDPVAVTLVQSMRDPVLREKVMEALEAAFTVQPQQMRTYPQGQHAPN